MATEMREPTFWILTALAGGRRHGYALLRETEQLSGGRVQLKVPTLYAALERMTQEGTVAIDGEETVDGRPRRYFRLTNDGAQRLEREVDRLEANVAKARERLIQRPALRARAQFS
ncbi:MAG TPA: PadR family transcriptional regulator [Galbitalea sp.]|jgi:DNA-binding PadR family transcriptional regulator|nr:PadR family transcriptional regulator [Galbitalea sp.]